MSYQVLSAPEGTLGYKPREKGAFEEIFVPASKSFGKGVGKGLTDSIYKKAAEKEGLTPKYEIDGEGNVKTTYSKGTKDSGKFGISEVKKRTQAFIAGLGTKEDYGFETDAEMEAARKQLREEISADKHLKSYFGIKDDPAEKPNWEADARKAMAGEMTWEELSKKWPTKDPADIEDMKLRFDEGIRKKEPIAKSEKFVQASDNLGGKVSSAFNANKAQISPETEKVIANIKTQGDYDELLANAAEYQKAGVDVKAIKEYFGRR